MAVSWRCWLRENGWELLLPLALTIYLVQACPQLALPGLNYDEALDAVPAMQFVLREPIEAFATVRALNREWPLMVMPYIGATSTYLLIPAFALAGAGVVTLRATGVILGAATLMLAWYTVRSLFDRRVAGLAALLLACSPSYVFWTRMPAYIAFPVVPLALGTVYAGWRWYSGTNRSWLVVAALLTGLGLYTKILFVWLPVSLAVAWILLAPRRQPGLNRWLWPWTSTPMRIRVLAAVAGLVGVAPLLAYNVLSGGGTVSVLARNLTSTELYGVSNLALLQNLRTVFLTDLRAFLDGSWFSNVLGDVPANPVPPIALLVSIVLLVILGAMRKLRWPRRVAWVGILVACTTAQSAVTVSNLGANHLAILWPWPQVLIALAATALLDLDIARAWPTALLAGLLILAPAALDMRTVWAYHSEVERVGGEGLFSDAIYALASDLAMPNSPAPVALDWGFRRNIQLLTGNAVSPEDGYTFCSDPGIEARTWLEERILRGDGLYLLHTPEHTVFSGYDALLAEAAYRLGREPVLRRTYVQRDGRPVYRVYEVVAATPLQVMPEDVIPMDAEFDKSIALLGYELENAEGPWLAGSTLRLTLYWRTTAPLPADYAVFVHLSGSDESIVTQHDGMPALWSRPTTGWAPGELIEDRIKLRIPSDVTPGEFRLWVGMYDPADGERLPVSSLDRTILADRLLLTTLSVERSGP